MTRTANRPQSLRRNLARLTTVSLALAVAAGTAFPATAAHAATTTSSAKPTVTRYVGGAVVTGPVVVAKPRSTAGKASLPVSADVSAYHVAVANQGSTQSCVAWAIGYALMGWQARRAGYADPGFASYYVYSQINHGVDAGSSPSDAMDIVTTQGVDPASDYPQQAQGKMFTLPTAAQKANALPWRALGKNTILNGSIAGVAGRDAIKATLAAGQPVAILMYDRPGLQQLTAASNVDYDITGYAKDNHEVLALAYNSTGLYIQNSWGTGWGSGGFGWLSWSVVEHDVFAAHSLSGLARSTTTTDSTGPTVTALASVPQLGSSLATSGVTKYVHTFTASDPSGVASTLVDVKVDTGNWVPLTLPAATTTSFTYDLTPGHTYQFSVAAYDTKNNFSGWLNSAAFTVGTYNENYGSYSSGWSTLTWASAVNGAFASTATANASATFTFNGRGVAWVVNKDTNRGQAWVYIDGVYQGVWDTYSATSKPRSIVLTKTWATNGSHTVQIVNVATSGRPNLDFDAMVVTY